MTSVKDRHYWSQLRAALTGGQWLAQHPAKTPHGAPLSWSELLRKFNKHCKGFKDVAEVASQTQGLALLLSASSLNEDEDRESDVGLFQLQLDGECILPEERVGEATSGYETLKTLETSNFDTINLALAYYAYALGNPSDCISHLSKISNLYQTVPIVGSFGSSTTMLTVPGAGSQSIATSASGSFVSFADMTVPEVKDGRGWAMTETFRSICLHGMSHEQLYPTEAQKALKAYREAIPLFATLQTEYATISTPSSTGKPDWTSFVQLRELWRWVERLIWRGVVLSSRHGDQESLWAWLNHYNTTSTCWPPTFRTSHRSTVSTIHLRALILRHGCLAPSPLHLRKSAAWVHTARSVIQDYRAILSMCTKFPRAGERNVRVEEFVDLCVAVWEGSGAVGEHAGWVLDILWWATRLTFNSSRILRHMTRLLYLSGDVPLAKRTLRLYIQVVGKSYEASNQDIAEDIDTDDNWVETLVFGARMLCRHASALLGVEGLEDVKEAGTVLEKARTRLDKDNVRLRASIEQAEGIIKSLLAIKEEDPYTRSQRVAEAHAHLLKSVELHPTSSGHYHLAISFSRPGPHRDMEQAIEQAGMAVEADPTEVRYWHLLGLLLTAVEKWVEAVEILEHGAELDDSYSCEREKGEARVNGDVDRESDVRTVKGGEVLSSDSVPNGNASGVFVAPNGRQQQQNGVVNKDETTDETRQFLPILEEDVLEIPPAAGLFKSILRVPIPSEHNIFEYSLQLRMTQVALTEVREGAEGAEQQWLEVFAWIAEKKGLVCESIPRSSIDGPGPTLDMNVLPQDQEKHAMANGDNPPNELPPPPIPIMISPATPIIETAEPGEGSPTREKEKRGADKKHSHHTLVKKSSLLAKSSSSFERDREGSKSTKKINQMLKSGVRGVHKSGARLTAVSRKIGSGVVRNGSLRRSTSTPDFHAVLRQTSYQASSIHSRRRLSSIVQSQDGTPSESPPPPPPPPQAVPPPPDVKLNSRLAKEKRMLSDLWLMSAATFRRLGKIEQAKGAIQEAEVRDENNPAVWVQLALYYVALGHHQHAIDALQKALFISPYDVSATVHLGRLYLTPNENRRSSVSVPKSEDHSSTNMDLAASLLGYLTKGRGWDVPEAWYFLAKAYGMQGRKERERDALALALELSEHRGVREIGAALGWCI